MQFTLGKTPSMKANEIKGEDHILVDELATLVKGNVP